MINSQSSLRSFVTLTIFPAVIMLSCNEQNTTIKQADHTTPATEIDSSHKKLTEGAICTVADGENKFGVIKILVIDEETYHVKIYKNKYESRPDTIDLTSLSMGKITDKDGAGIGHVPLAKDGFFDWSPVVVTYEKVDKEELEGYEIWKAQ